MTSFDVAALIAEKCEAFITPVRLAGAERAFLSRIAAAYVGGARLFVRGPNIMLGYYRAKNPGVIEALSGGLYDMGDIVAIDRQGFVAIKGRAKRFAKIAGESVSLGSIEEIIAGLWPEHIAAAIAAPDPKAGRTRDPGDHQAGRDAGRGADLDEDQGRVRNHLSFVGRGARVDPAARFRQD